MRQAPMVFRWCVPMIEFCIIQENRRPLTNRVMYTLFARTTEEGAKTMLWASLEDTIPPGTHSSSCELSE